MLPHPYKHTKSHQGNQVLYILVTNYFRRKLKDNDIWKSGTITRQLKSYCWTSSS